jgi:hypothetical protein
VVIDVQIAFGLYREIEQAVTRDLVEHVIQKRDTGSKIGPPPYRRGSRARRSSFPGVSRWDFRTALAHVGCSRASGRQMEAGFIGKLPRLFSRTIPLQSSSTNRPARIHNL